MRVLKLRFKNLNSLVGEWEIDLEHPAYRSDGIFAITGPTGAGKSTILDAICLALYGRTPRLSRVTRSGNEIMSRHTGECFAEVTFETQSGRYRCHWSQHRSRKRPDAELQAPKHEIADADSNAILESKLKGVAEQIEAATGMDFERFTRSMLLAQGGFAAFLQAPADERAPILEQITGTEIYSRISMRVHELRREQRERLDILHAETEGIAVLQPEQEAELRQTLVAMEAEERQLAERLANLDRAIAWLRAVDELQNDLARLAEEDAQLQRDIEAFQPDQQRLGMAEAAVALEGLHATLTATRKQQHDDAVALQAEEAALPDLEAAAVEQAAALETAETRTTQVKTELKDAGPRLQRQRSLDQKLRDQAAAVSELEESRNRELTQSGAVEREQAALLEQRATAATQLSGAQRFLDEHARDEWLAAGLTGVEEQLRSLLAAQAQIAQQESREAEAAAALDQAQQLQQDREKQCAQRREELETATTRLQLEKTALHRLLGDRLLREYRAEKETLLREQALHARIAELEDHRALLEDGKPCPLCGATEHPFAEGALPRTDDTEQKIAELGARIDAAEEHEATVAQLAQAEAAAHHSLTEAEKAEAAAAADKTLAERAVADLRQQRETLRADVSARRQTALASLQPLGIREIDDDGVSALIESLRARLDAWREQVGKRAETEKRIAELDVEIGRCKTTLKMYGQALEEKERRLASLRQELAAGRTERRAAYGDTNPDEEEARLNDAVSSAEREEKQARDRHHVLQEKWSSARSRAESLKARIAERRAELAAREDEFASALEPAGFSNEQAFLDARLTAEQRRSLKQRAAELDERRSALAAHRTDREQRLAAQRAEQLTDRSLDELEPQRRGHVETLKQQTERIAETRHRLRENDAARERLQDKQKEVEAQRLECRRWDALHELIGSADGKKYRNFAQGLTFEIMIAHANRQLQKLTDRYLLTREDGDSLELSVYDNYQAGEMRSTKNLSGGESFIVSLALALGLSQMAGKNVRVDSLFLDEGFGTLDEEALDTALETLAGLQQDGKVIGIISHVGALKERISTRIQVTPHSGGQSRIFGPGCCGL